MTSSTPDPPPATPRLLAELSRVTAEAPPDSSGALWRLAESGRQLDANLVRLPPGERVGTHTEPELDVLLLVVAGDGELAGEEGPLTLTEGALVWLPHGATRGITAGERGLCWLTVHRRRPGLRVRRREEVAGPDGDAPGTTPGKR